MAWLTDAKIGTALSPSRRKPFGASALIGLGLAVLSASAAAQAIKAAKGRAKQIGRLGWTLTSGSTARH
jgi:hypothetical protein